MSRLNFGETTICRWKDDKTAAYSVGGDDCLRSQLFFAIPEMDKRGLRGTWWVNPGRGGSVNYIKRDDEWAQCWIACYDQWKAAAARGHDFGNHTLHHIGAATYAEADEEIGRAAKMIWRTNPRQRLQLFLRGGRTNWGISVEQIGEILASYDCVPGRGGGVEDPTWEVDPDADYLKSFVDAAIQEGSWHLVGFHGIGPKCEWGGPLDAVAFTAMLDYLVAQHEMIWCGTHTEVHKYDRERISAAVTMLSVAKNEIRLELSCARDPRLYDYPLTLRTAVDTTWERVLFSQGGVSRTIEIIDGVVQYDALPNQGEISIRG
jgi:hypothetical protein